MHKHISHITLNVWSHIFEWLPLRAILLLLETGDSRIIRITRRGLQNLQLKRTQTRYKPFPLSLLSSFRNIRSLTISTKQSIDCSLLNTLSYLLKKLCSLTIIIDESTPYVLESFGNLLLYLYEVNDESGSMLSEFTIDINTGAVDFNYEQTNFLGNILKQMPYLNSFICNAFLDPSILVSIPKSISHLEIVLTHSALSVFPLEAIHFTNLLTLKFTNYIDYDRKMDIVNLCVIHSKSLTDLDINTFKDDIWNILPPHLTSLSVLGSIPKTREQVSNIPRSVTHLSVSGCLEPELVPYLPNTLKTLRNSGFYIRSVCVDPSTLPPSLTEFDMFDTFPCGEWKYLPRRLVTIGIKDNPFYVYASEQLVFLRDLPTSLASLKFSCSSNPTFDDLRSISSRNVLKYLDLEYITEDIDSINALCCSYAASETESGSAFPSLETLVLRITYINFDLLSKLHLPSLVELTIYVNQICDLYTLLLPTKLKTLSLRCSDRAQDSEIPYNAFPSFLLSLPPNLTYLALFDYFIDTSDPSFKYLPKTLVYAKFSVVKETFSFKHLSYLPNSIETLYVRFADSETEHVIRTYLQDILTSLPKSIEMFTFYVASKHRNLRVRLILEDCIGDSISSSDSTESLKMNIFCRYSPPFMKYFGSKLIDPEEVFKKAKEMMGTP